MFAGRRFSGPGVSWPLQTVYSGANVAVPLTFLASTFASPDIRFGLNATTNLASVNSTADSITIPANNGRLITAESVEFYTTGTLPAPLVVGTIYFVINIQPDGATFSVSSTSGGTAIDILDQGSGTHSCKLHCTDLGARPIISRGLDSCMPSWAVCHTASGVFNWTTMDSYMDYHYKNRGRQTVFCFNQTPSWAARNQALDAYGAPGGGQVPTTLSVVSEFVTALLQRYNSVSAYNPTGVKMFSSIEIWNEPTFSSTGAVGNNWCGTMGELVQFARLVNLAAKAVDASIVIISPGFTNALAFKPPGPLTTNSLYSWLLTSDGLTGTGLNWIDAVAYHGYDTSDTDLVQLANKVQKVRNILVSAGLSANYPLYMTERGVDVSNHPLHALRCAAIEAALGLQLSVMYKFDGYGNNPRNNVQLRNAINVFYDNICGKNLTYCAINQNGSVTVTASGTTVTF
jgi:hypothetical protein